MENRCDHCHNNDMSGEKASEILTRLADMPIFCGDVIQALRKGIEALHKDDKAHGRWGSTEFGNKCSANYENMMVLNAKRMKDYCREKCARHDDCKDCLFRKNSHDGMEYYCQVNFPCDWWI